MTIIAAYRGPDGVYMAGDSMAADANDTIYVCDPKVFAFSGFTIGYAGSFRLGQILNHCFNPPPHNPILDDSTYMFSVWLENLRETLDSYGLLKTENGVDGVGEDGSALVAYRDNLYHIQEDLSILKVSQPFSAIGVGMSYAIGAMHALHGTPGMSSEDILSKAMSAAVNHCPRCGGTITMIKHEPSAEVRWRRPRSANKKKPKIVESAKKI